MNTDPFNVRSYWEQLNEPEPARTPVAGGFRWQRFNVGDKVKITVALAGQPPVGEYTIAGVACDSIEAGWPGCGEFTARYDLAGCNVPTYDENLERA
jgi:hypothetical protein